MTIKISPVNPYKKVIVTKPLHKQFYTKDKMLQVTEKENEITRTLVDLNLMKVLKKWTIVLTERDKA